MLLSQFLNNGIPDGKDKTNFELDESDDESGSSYSSDGGDPFTAPAAIP